MKQGYRGNLLLVELMIVVMFFTLSAMISLGVFVQARVMERESAALTQAERQARAWCEMLSLRSDSGAYLTEEGFLPDEDGYRFSADALLWHAQITEEAADAGKLVTTSFTAEMAEHDDTLYALSATCYFPKEVTP